MLCGKCELLTLQDREVRPGSQGVRPGSHGSRYVYGGVRLCPGFHELRGGVECGVRLRPGFHEEMRRSIAHGLMHALLFSWMVLKSLYRDAKGDALWHAMLPGDLPVTINGLAAVTGVWLPGWDEPMTSGSDFWVKQP